MSAVFRIARAELAWLSRSHLATVSTLIFLALLALSVMTSTAYLSQESAHRQSHQDEATDIFEEQPDRHPHRMVHYGHYVFRTPPPLAAIDPGLDAYGGTSIFLEGHRQNAAMFAGAGEGAALVRFGGLTPAFTLQVLAPLLLILIGHSSLTRERETSTLQVLLAQGVGFRRIALGKLLVLLHVSAVCLAVLAVAAFASAAAGGEGLSAAGMLVLAHGAYLGLWSVVVVGISAWMQRSSSALLTLAALWMVTAVVVPRLAADVAGTVLPLESAFARNMQLTEELRALGDSHDPSDPNYQEFLSNLMAEYGATTPDEMSVNIRGLLAVEGERQSAELLARFNAVDQEARMAQQELIEATGIVSPMLVMQMVSQRLAGTDLAAYHRFLNAAEEHRVAFVQELNMLQATDVDYALDKIKSIDVQAEKATRISAEAWSKLPTFSFDVAPGISRIASASSGLLLLSVWFAAGLMFFVLATRRQTL